MNNQNTINPGTAQQDKDRFFHQYYGVQVHRLCMLDGLKFQPDNRIDDNDYLELTPLSDITDEDANVVGEICDFEMNPEYKREILSEHLQEGRLFPQETFDYLRSKGYALPWMGYSVEEMAQAGWIKLKGGK